MTAFSLAACQTPGYEYSARAAPNFPAALDYTDVRVGRFSGPGGQAAQQAFIDLIEQTELDGQPWFNVEGQEPAGIYEGSVEISRYGAEHTTVLERRCGSYEGLFNCRRHVIVERKCTKRTVNVDVTAVLRDMGRRPVFTSRKGGETGVEDCVDVAEYPDSDITLGQQGPSVSEVYGSWEAPIGMVDEAVRAAVAQFRNDIAPYVRQMRAEIMTRPLSPEETGDARFAAAVKATKRGDIFGACAQWEALATDHPAAAASLHNAGACAEANGDLVRAQALYATAADLARAIPLVREKDVRPIFDSLERVSKGRRDETLIDTTTGRIQR